jgi:hypothetical protein
MYLYLGIHDLFFNRSEETMEKLTLKKAIAESGKVSLGNTKCLAPRLPYLPKLAK